MMTQMTPADRRSNQARAIAYRDEYLEQAAELRHADLTDVKILRACTDLHGDMIGFLDGALIAHFPGVAARMRAGLAAIGWTFAFGEECRAKYNAIMKATNFTGVVVPDGKCQRCGGAGRISAYSHVSGGECFDCGGSGLADDCEVA